MKVSITSGGLRRSPSSRARAVDRQSLGEENLGPYALARRDMIGQPKTALLAGHLQPLITVVRHDEELDLFVPRITRWHLQLPALVINGLDEVEPRHLVQRLWPDVLVDMAAGGTTSQVIVNRRGEGQCLLGAFAAPDAGLGYIQRTKTATGLRPERFLNEFTTPVTAEAEDVAQAPPGHRARLQAAAESGQRVCGYINQASMTETSADEDFAPRPVRRRSHWRPGRGPHRRPAHGLPRAGRAAMAVQLSEQPRPDIRPALR